MLECPIRKRTLSDTSSIATSSFTTDENKSKLSSSLTQSMPPTKRLSSKIHLFQIINSWRPTYCVLCSSLIGWRLKGYRCEVCKLICCTDCQLRVDVELPCGSPIAISAVEKAEKSRLSVGKLFSVVAPIKEEETDKDGRKDENGEETNALNGEHESSSLSMVGAVKMSSNTKQFGDQGKINSNEIKARKEGVGSLKIRILKACLFQQYSHPEAELSDLLKRDDRWLKSGDHYARISWSGGKGSKRTKTVFQTAKPIFESEEFVMTADNYGTEFRIEVLDANTDKPVGTALVSTQGLLQWQRDELATCSNISFSPAFLLRQIKIHERKITLELRSGVKSGFGLDFYTVGKTAVSASNKRNSTLAGEISGWIEVEMHMEENPDLFCSTPKPVPARPPDDFNTDIFQLHIARIGSLIEDMNKALNAYLYMISWKDPALTGCSLILFTTLCVGFDAEYFGSLPIFILLVYMIYLGKMRRNGGFKLRWLQKERDASIEDEKRMAIKYGDHRSVGRLEIAVSRGKNLKSEHGIPGRLVAMVLWDAVKFLDEKTKEGIAQCDYSTKIVHQIGITDSSGVTSNPVWTTIKESSESLRLQQLIATNFRNDHSDLPSYTSDAKSAANQNISSNIIYPILQPIVPGGLKQNVNIDGNSVPMVSVEVLPWDSSPGAIIVQVRFADVINKLPIFDEILGDVVIPISKLAEEGKIEGWFRVLEKGTRETKEVTFPAVESEENLNINHDQNLVANRASPEDKIYADKKTVDEVGNASEVKNVAHPMIYLKVGFTFHNTYQKVSDTDRETSIVIAEEMIRSAIMAQDSSPGFIGSSINTLNTVRGVGGNLQYLQNQLGGILDKLEMARNLVNFSCPGKSALLFACLAILWLLLLLIPTRIVFLCAGLGQYAATFLTFYSTKTLAGTKEKPAPQIISKKEEEHDPILTRIKNFFMSVPTDEDLRRFYFWEARKAGEREREISAKKKRTSRLTKLWKAQWFGKVEMKVKRAGSTILKNQRPWDWEEIFVVILGHRLIWWKSEKHFDDGDNPLSQIFFAGHSGLAGLSPLDLREMKKSEIPLVVSIFGRGPRGQEKVSLLTSDSTQKYYLENSVMKASMCTKHD